MQRLPIKCREWRVEEWKLLMFLEMIRAYKNTCVIGIQRGSLVSKSSISVSFRTPVLSNTISVADLFKLIKDPEGLSLIESFCKAMSISSFAELCKTLSCSSTASKNSSSLPLSMVSTTHFVSFGEPGNSNLFIEEGEAGLACKEAEDEDVLTGFEDCS